MAQCGKKKGSEKTGGRQKGTRNKTTTQLKTAILGAAHSAGVTLQDDGKTPAVVDTDGNPEGVEQYLVWMAINEPRSFASLLGKVLPLQLAMEVPEGAEYKWNFEVVPKKKSDDTAESTNPVH